QETSYARMKIFADSTAQMNALLEGLTELGAVVTSPHDARTEPPPAHGALPDDFYSTTNMATQIRLGGQWLDVANTEMDLTVVVNDENTKAERFPFTEVKTVFRGGGG